MHRRLVVAAALVAVGAVAAAAPAEAKSKPKPKPWSKTVSVTDGTPDPTGGAVATDDICNGALLPAEKGYEVKITRIGTASKLKASLDGITGDWGLAIRDSKGTFLAGDDVNPPDALESASYKLKKTGTYYVQACNLGAVPTATLKLQFVP